MDGKDDNFHMHASNANYFQNGCRIWFIFVPFEKLRKFINLKKYAQKR